MKRENNNISINPSPIRVLIIGFYGSRGGVETSTMNYYRNFDHSKVQYDFVNPYTSFYYREEITSLGGRVYDVANFRSNPIKYMTDVYRIIRGGDYDVVNIPMLSAVNPLPIIVAAIARVNHIIVHSHNSGTNSSLKTVLHHMNKPIINMLSSYQWSCSLKASQWMFYRKARLVNNAIDLNVYRYDELKRTKIRKEFNISNELVLGNIARLMPEKNHMYLLDILHEFRNNDPDAKLLIVGDGPCFNELRLKAQTMNISDGVIFTGDRADASDFYSAMDVFVMPSKFEGLPMVGIEAQASGIPVVCADTITNEMDVTQTVRYLSLALPPTVWCDAIRNVKRISIEKSQQCLTANKYNIKKESKAIEDFYVNL